MFSLIYLSFWWRAFRGSFFCLSTNDRFQGPFFKLKHRVNTIYIKGTTKIVTNLNTRMLWTLSPTFNLFSWSCSMTLILRRVSSSFFNSCRRLCIFTGIAAIRPFPNTEREEISSQGCSHMTDFMLITMRMVVVFNLSKCLDFMTCVEQQVSLANVFKSLTSMLVQIVWNMTGKLSQFAVSPCYCPTYLGFI